MHLIFMCIYFEALRPIRARKFALFWACNYEKRQRSILVAIVAVAFKKFALNAFSFAHPEKNFRLRACASPIRFASLYAYDHYNRNISPACELIASNGISPFFRKISYKGKLQYTTTSGSRLHEPSGRRRAWNSIIAPEVVCITAPNIAKAARRGGDSDFYAGEMRWGDEEHARCWFDLAVINGRLRRHDLTLGELALARIK